MMPDFASFKVICNRLGTLAGKISNNRLTNFLKLLLAFEYVYVAFIFVIEIFIVCMYIHIFASHDFNSVAHVSGELFSHGGYLARLRNASN
jgi:hypothetical protein